MNAGAETAPASQAGVVFPFLLITLIWGSTWLVIRDQIGSGGVAVPPSWSVTYRFAVAAIAMFASAKARGLPLILDRQALVFAAFLGVSQFSLNFNFVYRSEIYLTSGLVAVLYALLIVPNSLFGWIWFRQPVTRAFLIGSGIALAGVALLFLHEYRVSAVDPSRVLLGIGFALAGLLCASASNVIQGMEIARTRPMLVLLAWAMLAGSAVDGLYAFATTGPPVFDPRPAYALGILYLALIGSVVTFPLYFLLIQRVGAGRAAYTGVLTPVIAMLLSTLFEDYRWSLLAASGGALAMLGMVVALRARARPA